MEDLDAMIGTSGYSSHAQNRLWLNDGTGRFTDATAAKLPAINDYTNAICARRRRRRWRPRRHDRQGRAEWTVAK